MCQPTESKVISKQAQPSFIARYAALSVTVGTFSVWHKLTFVNEEEGVPGLDFPLHSIKFPLGMIAGYLISLPVMNYFVSKYLAPRYDMKALLFESMVFYNVAQVCMNVWMVWRFVNAVVNRGHPFIGNTEYAAGGTTFAIWVHYTNKYLEFLDTYFMVLRGKMDQVSFLHVYHHATIALAWWVGLSLMPGGDSYFGALLNSFIHVMMYSYYALALFKIPCPWKRFLTQAQLTQFMSVIVYSGFCTNMWGEKRTWEALTCIGVQVGEMSSLFFLFMAFYKRKYSKGKKSANAAKKQDDDQCSKAMGEISSSVAKNGEKLMKKANNVVNATM